MPSQAQDLVFVDQVQPVTDDPFAERSIATVYGLIKVCFESTLLVLLHPIRLQLLHAIEKMGAKMSLLILHLPLQVHITKTFIV